MTFVKWNDTDSVHVKIIDEQHRHFVGLLNSLYACLESDDMDKISNIIGDLASYTLYHFKTEEEYFDKFCYEGAADHKAAHNEIKAKVVVFLERRKDDPKTVGFDLLYFLERWFFVHLKGMDKRYTECFNKNGLR